MDWMVVSPFGGFLGFAGLVWAGPWAGLEGAFSDIGAWCLCRMDSLVDMTDYVQRKSSSKS
jgi:hypothetical protein